ncbi:MAG: RNA pseudouridine synthase [Candidatus Marinimicrobia bacterium]|nr:RNA pseudouridine synthase [Candidatus Neomarinimicrobiota bacterium]|tara:strand:- start:3590 stop:4549 length:960 start_codon:yes stop_codon:yes gene_type:complete
MSELQFDFHVDSSGERIDLFLTKQLSELSRSKIQKYIKNGSIRVSGNKVKPSWILSEGEDIIGNIQTQVTTEIEPESIPLNILYEDDHLIIINKTSGLVVHPGNGVKNGTLVNALIFHFNNLSKLNPVRPGIVHRLDKQTSGVILVAKSEDIHHKLARLFERREIRKKYKAIIWGKTKNYDSITTNICRNPANRTLFATSKTKGKEAHTNYSLDSFHAPLSVLSIGLKTGRTHQIRVHMKSIGHPILCDEDYSGGKKMIKSFHQKYNQKLKRVFKLINRVALHAELLEFIHPVSGENLKVIAPLPEDMKNVISLLNEYA